MEGFDPERELPLREISFQFVRSSGAGGQNVNKVASKAVLRWNVRASAGLSEPVRTRLIAQNRRRISSGGDLVLSSQRFHAMLRAASVVPKQRRDTRPTRGSRLRRLEAKRRQSRAKSMRRPPQGED
jgi:ribosome-associated protein